MPETFPDATIDDVSLLTKRTAEGIYDITLVETTCMNMGQHSDCLLYTSVHVLTGSSFKVTFSFSGSLFITSEVISDEMIDVALDRAMLDEDVYKRQAYT